MKEKEDATDLEDTMSEREAQLDDVEVASHVTTPNINIMPNFTKDTNTS